MKHLVTWGLATALALAGATVASAQQKGLDTVKARGMVNCGVGPGTPGFSNPDDKGNWTGLDVDYCKAIAAAVLGDATKVKYVPTTAKERFTARDGAADATRRDRR